MKVLVVRAGALGDLLLLRRTLAALRRAGAELTLLAPSAPGGALVGGGAADVHALLPYERAECATLFADAGAIAEPLAGRLGAFDLAIVYSTNQDLARRLAAVVPEVLAHDPTPPSAAGHASGWLAAPLAGLGIDASFEPPRCVATADERAAGEPVAGHLPTGFLAVHPGSGSPLKNWPADRFASLVERACPDQPWLLVEGPADGKEVQALARVPGAVRARELPFRVLGALLGRAGAYLGNDSGISHLAAAWGAPTVALFGPTLPEVWAPLGARVFTVRSASGRLDGIAVDTVLAAVTELGGRGLARGS